MDPFEDEQPIEIEDEDQSPNSSEKRKRSDSSEKPKKPSAAKKAKKQSAKEASDSGKAKAKEEVVVVCSKKAKKEVPELVQKYADAVNNSEGVVRWDDITKKALSRPERSEIRHQARELGLIPEVPMVDKLDRNKKPIECPVFPEKCVATTLILPEEQFDQTDAVQFEYLNKQVKIKGFNPEDQSVTDEETGKVKRYTWHHHHDTGKMQLVESGIHSATKHKGGREIWTTGPRK